MARKSIKVDYSAFKRDTDYDPGRLVDVLYTPSDFISEEKRECWVSGYAIMKPVYIEPVINSKGEFEFKEYKRKFTKRFRKKMVTGYAVVRTDDPSRIPKSIVYSKDRVRPHDADTSVSFSDVYATPTSFLVLENVSMESEKEDLRLGMDAFGELGDEDLSDEFTDE